MGKFVFLVCAATSLLVLHATLSSAKPLNSRVKRVSDQRLAELETLIGLQRMRGKLVTVPVAGGVMDIKQIGRKRRSQNLILTRLFNTSDEDENESEYPSVKANLLQHMQRSYAQQQELERQQQLEQRHNNYPESEEEKLDDEQRLFYLLHIR